MIPREELFISTLKDIRERIKIPDKYNYLRACGFIRQILIDDKTPLYVQVNGKYNLPIKFKVNAQKPPDNYFIAFWVDVSYYEGKTEEININQFLARHILTIVDMKFTIKDFIHTGAYVHGGIHTDVPKTEAQKIINVLDTHTMSSAALELKSIKGICDVTIDAMRPLEDAILGHTTA